MGKVINLTSGDITSTVNSASSGDTIQLAQGNFTISGNAYPKPGVNIRGAGVDKTVITNYAFSWWQGAFDLSAGDGLGQVLEGFTLKGDPNKSFEGIRIGRSNVTVRNVKVEKFFYSGIEVQSEFEKTLSNILIDNFVINESSKESTAGSFGNLIFRGALNNVVAQNGQITHLTNGNVGPYGDKASGYGIKCFSNWANGDFSSTETQVNCKILNVKCDGKDYAPWGNDVPNFSMEVWNVHVDNFEIANCSFNNQLSLEHGGQKQVARSFWVHDNNLKPKKGQAIELTASYSVVEKNNMTLAGNSWNLFGTYNDQKNIKNIIFRNNSVDLSGGSPCLVCAKGQYVNLQVTDNVFNNGNPTLVWFRGGNSAGSSVTFKNNNLPSKYTQTAFEGVSASQVTFILVTGNPTTPTEPTQPTEPTTPVPPVIVTKTITITKTVTLGNPVWIKDEAKKQYVVTIPYEENETRVES